MKDLNYWKNNAEGDYLTTPLSVLRYISELEKEVTNKGESQSLSDTFEIIEGYKSHRHVQNPKEKEIHDNFLKNHNRKGYEDMDLIVFGHSSQSMRPADYLSDREKKIVLSTIQWLGSPIGQRFLIECGFHISQ